jgi:hypothetical protein
LLQDLGNHREYSKGDKEEEQNLGQMIPISDLFSFVFDQQVIKHAREDGSNCVRCYRPDEVKNYLNIINTYRDADYYCED